MTNQQSAAILGTNEALNENLLSVLQSAKSSIVMKKKSEISEKDKPSAEPFWA